MHPAPPGTRRGRGGGKAPDSPLPAVPLSPPPPHSVLQPSAGGGRRNPFPKSNEKNKCQTSFAFHPLPGYASERREVPAGSVLQGTRDTRRRAFMRDGGAPQPRPPAPLVAALPPAPSPAAPGGHRASRPAALARRPRLRHRRRPAPLPATGNL